MNYVCIMKNELFQQIVDRIIPSMRCGPTRQWRAFSLLEGADQQTAVRHVPHHRSLDRLDIEVSITCDNHA